MNSEDKIDFSNVEVPIPALLRVARRTYGTAIREALQEVDCEDMPRNGSYVIAGLALTKTPLEDLVRQLGVSKQAASQLVDTLVVRGYIDRSPDLKDRRKMDVKLTERGKLAQEVSGLAVDEINKQLTKEAGEETVNKMKTALAILIDINDRHLNLPRGHR